ncbi:hypothetical protein BC940DRAFT_334262 [Gongronella butleri]|nr:hypothetical protein BC940DRAFT_334262 [Gongronella butleri]
MADQTSHLLQAWKSQLDLLDDLSTRDRMPKRKAIKDLADQVKIIEKGSGDELNEILKALFPRLCKWTTCAVESVREMTLLALLPNYVTHTPTPEVETLLGCAVDRMEAEPTEELRQHWLDLMKLWVVQSATTRFPTAKIEPLMTKLITLAIKDECPEVKEKAADLVGLLAENQPTFLRHRGENTIRQLLPLVSYRRSAIRVKGVETIGKVLQCAPQGARLVGEQWAKLYSDEAPKVRTAWIDIAGSLILEWEPIDRYTHAGHMLPFLINPQKDDVTQAACSDYMTRVSMTCDKDMEAAGLVPLVGHWAGWRHLVHQCFDDLFQHMTVVCHDVVAQPRLVARKSLAAFLEHCEMDDLIKIARRLLRDTLLPWAMLVPSSVVTSMLTEPVTDAAPGDDEQVKKTNNQPDLFVELQVQHLMDALLQLRLKLSWPIFLDQLLSFVQPQTLVKKEHAQDTVYAVLMVLAFSVSEDRGVVLKRDMNEQERKRANAALKATVPHMDAARSLDVYNSLLPHLD